MNILISNDDGYKSSRLLMLKDILSLYGNVYVSAPLNQRSGASISITIKDKNKYKKIEDNFIAIDGTPADTITMGLSYFNDVDFDLVVTGINYGYNTSVDALYSGTVGASLIASTNGIPSIALSASHLEDDNLKEKAMFIIEYIFKNKILNVAPLININIPLINPLGIKVCKMYPPSFSDFAIKDGDGFIPKRVPLSLNDDNHNDHYYVSKGYYTISAMKPSLEDEVLNKALEEIIK